MGAMIGSRSVTASPRFRTRDVADEVPQVPTVVLPLFGSSLDTVPFDRPVEVMPIEAVSRSNRLTVLSAVREPPPGFRYPDLVAASDVVISKPGYGIISECIANGAALLYTSRGHFAEYDVLVSGMPRFLRCRFIAQDDLLAGRWTDAIDALLVTAHPGR